MYKPPQAYSLFVSICPSFPLSTYLSFTSRTVFIHKYENAFIFNAQKVLCVLASVIQNNLIYILCIEFSHFLAGFIVV